MHVGQTLSRRLTLAVTALAASTLPRLPGSRAANAAGGVSRDELLRKLSRVPVFVITNKEEAPYLTEVDDNARRSGFFYLGPQEAIAALKDIRAFDPQASLNVVSLDAIWFDVSKSAEEAAAAPQPKAGTSTDLRLFRLRPLQDEFALADRQKGRNLRPDDVPLFYDTSFVLSVDGSTQRPYFFRLPDLKQSYQQQAGSALVDLPSLQTTTLAALVNKMQAGDPAATEPPALLVAASEAAAVVERMSAGSTSSTAGGQVNERSPRGLPTAPESDASSNNNDPFFLSVPFGGGRKLPP